MKTIKLILVNAQQVVFVFLAFLTMVLVSYLFVSNIVTYQMQTIGEETMNTMQATVTGSLVGSELLFANMTQNVESMLYENQSNEEILHYLVTTNNFFSENHTSISGFLSVYGYIRGEFLDGTLWIPPDDYYPPSRPWHIGAVANWDSLYISEPYLDADTGGMCITFSQQVFDPYGQPAGIVAIDISLTMVTDYIAAQKITNDGYGVLLDDKMFFSSHPNSDFIGQSILEAGSGYPILAELLAQEEDVSAFRFTNTQGIDCVAFFRTIFNGWHIGIIIPRSSYYEQVYYMGGVLIILGTTLMMVLSYMLVHIRNEKIRSDAENMSKSGFLAHMSHEMRTPMNAIIGMTKIAKNTQDAKRVEDCLTKIDNAANHLLGVINDVLDMSKIEAGKFELSETHFLFDDMLAQVKAVVNVNVESKNQKLTMDIDPDIPAVVIADRQRMAQVLTNLLSNANKFTPEEGNIKLVVKKLSEIEGHCKLRIEVCDDGIGISKEHQTRLFQSFEQADGSTSRKFGGTGLGLAISKKIITLMNGEVWIDSELGKGSKFIFTASVRKGNEEKTETGGDKESENYDGIFKGKCILLAEDIEINREIVLSLLEDTEIEIDCAENGREALQMFTDAPGKYGLILMDVQMPEMDGYEATQQIRASGSAHGDIPIVAMTANVFREDVERCFEAGMNAHVGKPIDLDEVLAVMKGYLL